MNYISKISTSLIFMLTLSLHLYGNNLDNIYVIPFVKSSGLILLEAEIDGLKGHFIFDTGADALFVNEANAKSNYSALGNNNIGNVDFQSLNGSFTSSIVTIGNLTLGTYTLESLNAHTADLSDFENKFEGNLLGIIGAKLFNAEILRIDNIKKTIELIPRKHMQHLSKAINTSCPLRFENDIPIIDVTINDKKYAFALDTGSSISLIDEDFAKKHIKNFTQDGTFNLLTASEQSENLLLYKTKSLNISKMKISDLNFGAYDFTFLNSTFSNPLSGIISVDQLPVKELFVDYVEGRLYFLF